MEENIQLSGVIGFLTGLGVCLYAASDMTDKKGFSVKICKAEIKTNRRSKCNELTNVNWKLFRWA